jgi:GR25 family glycosyltransferase involved in LPS biosynthesis
MKAYVITIMNNKYSVAMAERCIESGRKHGIEIEMFAAYTPADDPIRLAKLWGIPTTLFEEKYSRFENCIAAFLSHRAIWKLSYMEKEPVIIFEHDAVINGQLPKNFNFKGVCNLGKPSYGQFIGPNIMGVGPFVSKKGGYFGGAHAYAVNPVGAKELLWEAKTKAGPTDIFIKLDNFPWLEELYPWIAVADDTFSTIQNTEGCIAKHNFKEGYECI